MDTSDLIVGHCRGRDILSRTIGWFGGGYFSHSTTLLPCRCHVIDARSDKVAGIKEGVRIRPVSYLAKYEVVWTRIPCEGWQAQLVYKALRSQLGSDYDKIGILNFATGQIKDRNWTREMEWFCSELVAYSWIKATILPPAIFNSLTPNRLPPGVVATMAWTLRAAIVNIPFQLQTENTSCPCIVAEKSNLSAHLSRLISQR